MFNSNLKKSILKDIYIDNLKVAGKHAEEDFSERRAASGKTVRVLLVLLPLVLTVTSFAVLDSFFAVDATLSEIQVPPTLAEVENIMVAAAPEAMEPDDFSTFTWDYLPYQVPFRLLSAAENQRFADYSLLLSGNAYTRLSSLFGLGIKNIVIDPGHGGKDPGAIGAGGTMEKDITLDVALRLKRRLDDLNRFNVLLTRDKDKLMTLAARVDFAKEKRADIFISIHVNSLPNETVNLIETYYFGPPLNSEIFRLAEAENKASHFSVSELEGIIQDIGNTVKRQESAMLAQAVQSSLYRHLSHQDPNVINSGVKMAPFVVLSQIEVPSVLVEISCITNEEEELKLKTSKYREKVASYIDEGILAYLDLNYFKTINGEK